MSVRPPSRPCPATGKLHGMPLLLALALFAACGTADAASPEEAVAPSADEASDELLGEIEQLRHRIEKDSRNKALLAQLSALAWQLADRLETLEATENDPGTEPVALYLQTLPRTVLKHTREAAKAGDGEALQALAVMERLGLLAKKDPESACRHYARAASAQLPSALFRHAECLIEADDPTALTILRQGATAGHATAQHYLGELLLRQEQPDAREEAAGWLYRAARQGRPSSQALLAWMYKDGIGVITDAEAAAALYRQSAEQGYAIAENNLGELYEKGTGVPLDPSRAATLYMRAAEKDFPPAQLNLARLFALGLGTERDPCAAVRWTRRALDNGFAPAQDTAAWLENTGIRCTD